MSVVCVACHTKNRDHAMFCHGCAGKLPGFAATGPAALDIMRPLRLAQAPATDARVAEAPSPGLLQLDSRAFWIRLGLIALAITVGFVGWYAYVTRRAAVPVRPVVSAPTVPLVKPAGPEPGAAPAQAAAPAPGQVSATEALSPGETLAPGRAVPQPPGSAAGFEPRNGAKQREPTRRRGDAPTSPGSATVRMAAADPRPGCAHLNFIAAARCQANQCLRAEFRSHPHCDAVREQTRRDEARRNLPN